MIKNLMKLKNEFYLKSRTIYISRYLIIDPTRNRKKKIGRDVFHKTFEDISG